MDLHPTGSNELLYIQNDKLSITVKGQPSHPSFGGAVYSQKTASLRVVSNSKYELSVCSDVDTLTETESYRRFYGDYQTIPMFFEQQRYEVIVEYTDTETVEFWHENYNIRSKVSKVGRNSHILSGVICFNNDLGFSDIVIRVNGDDYLVLRIEVYPSKISYKEDYQAIIADITSEVYSIVFDFMRKTYSEFGISDKTQSSPVEFFSIIQTIYTVFIKSVDLILSNPHHILDTTYQVVGSHKIKSTNTRTLKWIQRHSDNASKCDDHISFDRALAAKKQISYNTNENRLTKYILESIIKRLTSFKRHYSQLQRTVDQEIIAKIDRMIKGVRSRSNSAFLAEVTPHEKNQGMSLVFAMAPGYRELYKYYLMLLRGLSLSGDVFNVSIKDMAVLYEYWCFIKLNSIMKQKYELISQNIIKVKGNGLYVSLVKGSSSKVKYRNPNNGELIVLSYNPKSSNVPTIAQKPDNVLTLEKNGATNNYEYVFDAKYRINPALRETDYYNMISHHPGPEVDDINTMHRYRDAIVYQNEASPFERTMFGAYVLFPYRNEEEYRKHRFYESISKVNIGGLPFLPSASSLVEEMLDELILDSPDTAFERATLPKGIEQRLKKINWDERDVLVGSLKSKNQLDTNLKHKFYHVPVNKISNSRFPIRYIALSQSQKQFGTNAGIYYYGEVVQYSVVKRKEITEIPKESDRLYYRFEIKEWIKLQRPVKPKEFGLTSVGYTNLFLLTHSTEIPELMIRSESEYRFYTELKRRVNDISINEEDTNVGFTFNESKIILEDGNINVYQGKTITGRYPIKDFSQHPNAVFKKLHKFVG